jgi:hypothetical protein
MRLTTGKFSFDGLSGFQRKLIISALRRAAGTITCLRCQRIWRRPCSDRQSYPDEQDDYENDVAGSLQTPHPRGRDWRGVIEHSDASVEILFPPLS